LDPVDVYTQNFIDSSVKKLSAVSQPNLTRRATYSSTSVPAFENAHYNISNHSISWQKMEGDIKKFTI
jgi:hypothetical protein